MRRLLAIAFLLAFSLPAHADFLRNCESLTDAQRLEQSDIAGVGEITKTSCTCARIPYCNYTVNLFDMKKGEPQKLQFTDVSRLNRFRTGECEGMQAQANARRGQSEYFYFRKTDTGWENLERRNCER